MTHPDHILTPSEAETLPQFEPVYPLTAGVSLKLMRKAVAGALERMPDLAEWIDPHLVAERGWPAWKDAFLLAHDPQTISDLSPNNPVRQRLAYDELLAHQLTLAISRARVRNSDGRETTASGELWQRVLDGLPYVPTGAQIRAITDICGDMADGKRMSRMLQGDVGAGKTLVAMSALLRAVEAGGQGALMAPTEILARQHYASLSSMAETAGVSLEILTGRDTGAARTDKLDRLKSGQIGILVGTHALFQPSVVFDDLRLAVIDEQHRFGVAQRKELHDKGEGVDTLVMTATPIPRSLALAQFGDLDVSILDEKPPGRKPIKTAVMPIDRLDELTAHLQKALNEGRQAYWVCPLVNENETLDLAAAEARAVFLKAKLGAQRVGLVHGQMSPSDKDQVMFDFAAGKVELLVATTVIEVGVDVPKASIMVIEQADHFGLAQLHQLRGRVGRGDAASTCVLLYAPPLGPVAEKRLSLMRETEDGFRLAEEDLAMRGAGDVIGKAQSGVPRFRLADLDHHGDLMALAQTDARTALQNSALSGTPRASALRGLMWLMGQDEAMALLETG